MKVFILSIFVSLFLTASSFAQGFKDVSKELGINFVYIGNSFTAGGVALIDYDNDDNLDIYMLGGIFEDKLYKNLGNGVYKEVTEILNYGKKVQVGVSMGAAVGDVNNDGFDDIFITNIRSNRTLLYLNEEGKGFKEISESAGLKVNDWTMSATFVDINLDGFLDLYVTIYNLELTEIKEFRHVLFINNKNLTFTESGEKYGIKKLGMGLACLGTDIDNDNDIDLFVANDFGFLVAPNRLYRNEYPKDTLVEVATQMGLDAAIWGMGVGAGDYDGDGDLDYYVTNIGKNLLYRNDGNGIFPNKAKDAGIEHGFVGVTRSTSWSPIFFDYDNDGDEDFALSNGFVGEPNTSAFDPNKLYANDGFGNYKDVSDSLKFNTQLRSRGMVVGDLNNDGKQDLIVVNNDNDVEARSRNEIQYNKTNNQFKYIKVKVEGTTVNRNGFGTKLLAYSGSKKFIKEVEGGGGVHVSANSQIQHFGLGNRNKLDSLIIIWPGGQREKYVDLFANSYYKVKQGNTAQIVNHYYFNVCSNEQVEGNTFAESTTFTKISTSVKGYDSVSKYHVIVRPAYERTVFTGVCLGDSALGFKPTKDSTIIQRLKTIGGCDSIVTQNIKVSIPTQSSNTLSFCDVATYKDKQYNTSIVISEKAKNAAGCDSNISVQLIVNKSVIKNTLVELCSGDDYKGKSYTANEDIKQYSQTYKGCDSTDITQIRIKKPIENILVVKVEYGKTYGDFIVTKDTTISSTFSRKASNGCDSIYSVFVDAEWPQSVENELAVSKFSYSNVNSNLKINFKVEESKALTLQLLSISGELIYNTEIDVVSGQVEHSIPTNQLAKGVYYLLLKSEKNIFSHKVILD